MKRTDILSMTSDLISGERANTHGDAVTGFAAISLMWDALDMARGSRARDAEDVALAMIAVKLVRASANPRHLDNWIDMAGYAALGGEHVPEGGA